MKRVQKILCNSMLDLCRSNMRKRKSIQAIPQHPTIVNKFEESEMLLQDDERGISALPLLSDWLLSHNSM